MAWSLPGLQAGAEAYPAFAVTSDDTFVIGAVAASELAARKITQLVPGFGWLARGGNVTVDGRGPPVGEIAPRTLIGTDARGRLLLFEADGIEAGDVGLTLWQAAEWIQALGGHNVLRPHVVGIRIVRPNHLRLPRRACVWPPSHPESTPSNLAAVRLALFPPLWGCQPHDPPLRNAADSEFDTVVATDVLYHGTEHKPLTDFLRHILAPEAVSVVGPEASQKKLL